MKKFSVFITYFLLIFIIPALSYAGACGGGSTAVSVAKVVHKASDVADLADQFNSLMDQYGQEDSGDRKQELLEKAKDILSMLISQANDVESEVAILLKKGLDQVYAGKLDRVLSKVKKIRVASQARMETAISGG
jgi:hypothetical protein